MDLHSKLILTMKKLLKQLNKPIPNALQIVAFVMMICGFVLVIHEAQILLGVTLVMIGGSIGMSNRLNQIPVFFLGLGGIGYTALNPPVSYIGVSMVIGLAIYWLITEYRNR